MKAKGNGRKTQRLILSSKRKRFDKQSQKCNRKYWIKTQTELEDVKMTMINSRKVLAVSE